MSRGSCRSAATCPGRGGRSRPRRRTTPSWRGGDPSERAPRSRRRRAATPRWPIERLAAASSVRAGETGLDYYRTARTGSRRGGRSPRTLMARRWTKAGDPTVTRTTTSMPTRTACRATVLHCFSGDIDFAKACLTAAPTLFAGTVTFKNAANLRRSLAVAPIDRILVETDAPFLTPMPMVAGRTRPTSCRTVGRWPRCCRCRSSGCARRSTRTPTPRSRFLGG